MTPTTIGNVLLVAAAVPALLSVIVFARVRWYDSRWGKHVMAYMASVATMLALGVIRLFLGDHEWFTWLRVTAFGSVVIVLWWRLMYILQALKEGSPDDTAPADAEHVTDDTAPTREEAS